MHRTDHQWLDDIFSAITNIEDDTIDISFEEFNADRRRKDAVIRNFEIIGEATKKRSEDTKTRYPSVEWRRIAGLRDVLAHGYFRVDYDLIWDIIINTVPKFKGSISTIIRDNEQRRTPLND